MNRSKYTIEIVDNHVQTVANTLYGSLIDMDKTSSDIYYQILGGKEDQYPSETDVLLEQGILTETSEAEEELLSDMKLKIIHNKDELHLIILPTTACNMQCTYCFEHLLPSHMEESMMAYLMQFIDDCHDKCAFYRLRVTWFGGEPLLRLDFMRKFSALAVHYCEKHHIEYLADIVTNGLLLTKDHMNVLKYECRIRSIQVTLDGTKEIHNKRRPYGTLDGFNIIVNNLQHVCGMIPLVVRINVDQDNVSDTENLLQFLSGFPGIRQHATITFGKVVGEHPSCMNEPEFTKAQLSLYRLLQKYRFHESLSELTLQGRLVPCGAVIDNVFIIYPNGDLYKCIEVAGNPEYRVGNVHTFPPDPVNRIASEYRIPAKCTDCNKAPICGNLQCPLRCKGQDVACGITDQDVSEMVKIISEVQESDENQRVVA